MKCPNCSSQMFVTDETTTPKSHVVFFRCSLCVSEHVSSEPIVESPGTLYGQAGELLEQAAATRVQYAL